MDYKMIFCNIENNYKKKSWQITIRDDENNVINICKNIDDFYETMNELEKENTLEVSWGKDDDVSEEHFNEIKLHMDTFYYEVNAKEKNKDT